MKIKTITLYQPWATLWVSQVKRYETRGWRCWHDGPLAIHAAKRDLTREDRLLWHHPDYRVLLYKCGNTLISNLPFGVVIGICDKIHNHRTERLALLELERMLGDFSPGRWAWEPTNMRALPEPIPARGGQGIWEWEAPEATVEWLRQAGVRL